MGRPRETEGKDSSNISVNINVMLKRFMRLDAKRLGINHTTYIERLIAKRKRDAEPIKNYEI